jgi:hypothetical protein
MSLSWSRNSASFMEPEDSSSCSQEPATNYDTSLCIFLHSPDTSFLLGSHIFLNTLSNTLNLCSLLRLKQVSQTHIV